MRTRDVPLKYRQLFERAPTSRATAVKAMCLECLNFARADVAACSDDACPLWAHRPYRPTKSPSSALCASRIDAEGATRPTSPTEAPTC